ncbi:MAG: CinA family protein [Cyclobacteriaceae bacterium]
MDPEHNITYQKEEVSRALDQIKQICVNNELTLAVAESVSCGFLQHLFGAVPKAGLFFEGGMTVYNCQQKAKQLEIPEERCNPCNGVSTEIAEYLARNISQKFQCRLGISLTGYAAPIPEEGISQLFAYGSITLDNLVLSCKIFMPKKGQPDAIRKYYADSIILECAKILKAHFQ